MSQIFKKYDRVSVQYKDGKGTSFTLYDQKKMFDSQVFVVMLENKELVEAVGKQTGLFKHIFTKNNTVLIVHEEELERVGRLNPSALVNLAMSASGYARVFCRPSDKLELISNRALKSRLEQYDD